MRNPFKRIKKKEIASVNKDNYKDFLDEIKKAVDNSFNGQESNILQKVFEKELSNWIENTILSGKTLDASTVKLGVCLGLKESLRKVNESEQKVKINYIT